MNTSAKRHSALWAAVLGGAICGALGAGPVPIYAQKSPPVTSAASPPDQAISSVDAQRGALDRFLDSHPEIENDMIGSPTLINSPAYLRIHPELQAFLENHAAVKADPRAFLSPGDRMYHPHRSAFDEVLNFFVPFLVFAFCLLAFLWVLRTVWENRRWNRSFKMHEELHAKLIEKFSSGQDFSAYLQSDAGRRLLEWTPPVLDSTSRGLPNPLGRIFWSLQAGLVLLLVGLGLLLIRGHVSASGAPPLLVFGTLGVTLGAGFILSALVSYGLSQHLGLIGGAAQEGDSLVRR